jgi:hypothetical protein
MDWKPPPDITPRALDWRGEITVAIRDGLACRRCSTPLVEERDRLFVLIDPDGSDELRNVAMLCIRCRRDHADHPQPMPGTDERVETVC